MIGLETFPSMVAFSSLACGNSLFSLKMVLLPLLMVFKKFITETFTVNGVPMNALSFAFSVSSVVSELKEARVSPKLE